jgi:hypothetical protein
MASRTTNRCTNPTPPSLSPTNGASARGKRVVLLKICPTRSIRTHAYPKGRSVFSGAALSKSACCYPCPPLDCTELLSPSVCFEKPRIGIGTGGANTHLHLLRSVDIELKWTDWKPQVLPHSGNDNENDSGIPGRRAPKRLRRSAADGRRSRAYPTAAPWPSSHCAPA